MSDNKSEQPNDQPRRAGDWFIHVGEEQGELESVTSSALRHVLNSAAALGQEHRMPLEYKAREQKAGNNNFPFSSHDNRHDICNAAEYFDLGMGLRKLDPEKQRKNTHNIFEWVPETDQSGKDDFLTIYRTSFKGDQIPAENAGSCSCRRYPKHHTHPCNKPAPEDEKALQPYKSP